MHDHASNPQIETRFIRLAGRVQGVGFRPFVYRLARLHRLSGEVQNCTGLVEIRVQGQPATIDLFEQALVTEAPPLAQPEIIETRTIHEIHEIHEIKDRQLDDFVIAPSSDRGEPDIHVPPDYFTCDDCLQELTDPAERRYRYPFINCTQCGPRYSIIRSLPYDRPNTSMAGFPLCQACHEEYSDPLDRRFHAQPLACQDCGPSLTFFTEQTRLDGNEEGLAATVAAIRAAQIVAVKGVGGYHLICDAQNDRAVTRLRQRKQRPDKPLAVMFPMSGQDGLSVLRQHVDPTPLEQQQISQAMRPIVLVKKRTASTLSKEIAPGLSEIGVFLPYSPLHHLLLNDFGGPLVATSGNLSGEPVLTKNNQAIKRLATIADAFLQHDRPIERPVDDSVIRVIQGHPRTIRMGRGMAPYEVGLPNTLDQPLLAVGGQMKVTVALAWKNRCLVSPHISDLDTARGQQVFRQVILDLQSLYGIQAERIICDAHPGYVSTRWAHQQEQPVHEVFHHHAHAAVIAGEHPGIKTWLCFTWDGVGLGADGSLWGGEAFVGQPANWQHVASMRSFSLPGGDKAGRQPWRSEAALRWQTGDSWLPDLKDAELALSAWQRKINSPQSSAVGRLFDAAASMIMNKTHVSFEGQGPMLLEAIADTGVTDFIELPLMPDPGGILRADWSVLLPVLCDAGIAQARRAAIFHNSMAQSLINQALQIGEASHFDAIGLSGGVFQNRLLVERVISIGSETGLEIYLPETVPTNDGGLCFGQVIEYLGTQ